MGDLEDLLAGLDGFEWDGGNSDKNWRRHEVRQAETEQALLNTPLVCAADTHRGGEPRFIALGQSDAGRLLAVVFTVRGTRIRVISARAMSKKSATFMAKLQQSPKPIPAFKSEAEERRFWETHDSTDYVDWSSARPARFPKLKPSTETISLRLPAGLLADLKALANKQDVPYQSLLKVFLADRVAREWRALRPDSARANQAAKPKTRVRQKPESKLKPRNRAARG